MVIACVNENVVAWLKTCYSLITSIKVLAIPTVISFCKIVEDLHIDILLLENANKLLELINVGLSAQADKE